MKMNAFISKPGLFLFLLVTSSRCQVGTSGSFFEKIHGEEIAGDPNGPILKPEFFHCDRKESCTNVVQLKNGKYQTVAGEAEMKKIKNSACVWKKYSAAAQKKEEKACTAKALGMESGKILNSQITASSVPSNNVPYKARLNGNLCWMPTAGDTNRWLQVDFGKQMKVTQVATQGSGGSYAWTTSYEISYSDDRENFNSINKEFSGNTDDNGTVKNKLPAPIVARYFRINAKQWGGYLRNFALRIEFYGCEI